jgi:hypothetical protein
VTSTISSTPLTVTLLYRVPSGTFNGRTDAKGATSVVVSVGHPPKGVPATVEVSINGHAFCTTGFIPS